MIVTTKKTYKIENISADEMADIILGISLAIDQIETTAPENKYNWKRTALMKIMGNLPCEL